MSRTSPVLLTLLTLLAALCLLPVGGPSALADPAPPSTSGTHELTAADADAWLDGMVPTMLQAGDGAGVTVSIVKDGKLLTARGYGAANRWSLGAEGADPVDPAATQFRIGSISKLFTAVAAMQLVEQGKIGLNEGIDQYVDIQLDHPLGEPTIRHLLTHTAGYEEYLGTEFMQTDPEKLPSLREAVSDMPRQIHEPGTVSAYSNHGTALLGYIVEQVSGQPYDQYVQQHVLDPLGMERTTTAQPLPAEFRTTMAVGFQDPTVTTDPQGFELIAPAPAGSASSTATDMAIFANFLLGHGPEGVLTPETLQLMTSPGIDTEKAPLYENAVNTMGLQLWLTEYHGVKMVGHGGDTGLFHSMLSIYPELDAAVFISQNGLGVQGVSDMRNPLVTEFADRYGAPETELPAAVAGSEADAKALAGSYKLSREQRSGVLKLMLPLSQMDIVANKDGTVSLAGMPGTYRQVKKGEWRLVAGSPAFGVDAFTTDGDAIAFLPAHELHRAPAIETMPVFAGLLVPALLIGLLASIVAVTGTVSRWRARRHPEMPNPAVLGTAGRWGRRAMGLVGAGMVVAAGGVAIFLNSVSSMEPAVIALRIGQLGILAAAVGGVGAAIRAVSAIRQRAWSAAVWAVLVTIAAAVFVGVLAYYNLGTVNIQF